MEENIQGLLQKIIQNIYGVTIDEIPLEIPPQKKLGDYAFPCFSVSKIAKKSPQSIAQELQKYILENQILAADDANSYLSRIDVAGPYLNIFVQRTKMGVLSLIKQYNEVKLRENQKGSTVIVDYIGANVGKPLHIGHICTPTQGQAMINTYKHAGFTVISDSHIGDWGIIFGKLICAFKKHGIEEKLKGNAVDYLLELYIKITAESEEDDTLEEQFREEFKLLSEGNAESIEYWKMFTSESIDAMNQILARLNIHPDFNIGESFYEGIGLPKIESYPDLSESMHDIVNQLIDEGIAIKNEDSSVGVIFPEDTGIPSCILQKRNGTHGYLASDLACIKYRMQNWSPDHIVYFVDVRQKLHLEQVFYIANQAGWLKRNGKADTSLFHASNGFISGKEGAFSTRKGNIIKLGDLLDETEVRARNLILEKRDDFGEKKLTELSRIIGIGAIKYGYIRKKRTTDVVFDWDEFMTFEGNSGPYIQYAYVRALKLIKDNSENFVNNSKDGIENKVNPVALEKLEKLIKKLIDFNKENGVVNETIETVMPHIIAQYSYDLTRVFNDFYDKVRIASETDLELKNAFLIVIKGYKNTIENCFYILGIELPDEM